MVYRVFLEETVKKCFLVNAENEYDANQIAAYGISGDHCFMIDEYVNDSELGITDLIEYDLEDINEVIKVFSDYAQKNFRDFKSVYDLSFDKFANWTRTISARECSALDRIWDLSLMYSDSLTVGAWYYKVKEAIRDKSAEIKSFINSDDFLKLPLNKKVFYAIKDLYFNDSIEHHHTFAFGLWHICVEYIGGDPSVRIAAKIDDKGFCEYEAGFILYETFWNLDDEDDIKSKIDNLIIRAFNTQMESIREITLKRELIKKNVFDAVDHLMTTEEFDPHYTIPFGHWHICVEYSGKDTAVFIANKIDDLGYYWGSPDIDLYCCFEQNINEETKENDINCLIDNAIELQLTSMRALYSDLDLELRESLNIDID